MSDEEWKDYCEAVEELRKSQAVRSSSHDCVNQLTYDLQELEDKRAHVSGLIMAIADPIVRESTREVVLRHLSRLREKLLMTRRRFQNLLPRKPWSSGIDLDAVRSVPFESVLAAYNLEPHRLKINCPFHLDDTASFHIFSDDNHAHCFGCGWTGDSIKFIRELDKVSFKEACQKILAI